jgi:hypothetical protein
MTTYNYIKGRINYQRPQALLLSDSPGTLVTNENQTDAFYVPVGYEVGSNGDIIQASPSDAGTFLILSDHNRAPVSFKPIRIEKRERMVNGRMRSYHIADKLQISTSWEMLPSRGFAASPEFDENGVPVLRTDASRVGPSQMYTADGGAGGIELLDWYENHKGSFWLFLSYDRYDNFDGQYKYNQLGKYSDVIEVYITDFSYSVEKRGSLHDMWNVSISLEEV